MNCPHCTLEVNPSWNSEVIVPRRAYDEDQIAELWSQGIFAMETTLLWKAAECPSCRNEIILLERIAADDPETLLERHLAYPPFSKRKVISDKVPEALVEEYEEACKVLPISPKASAALSRRILQAMLEERGYESDVLAQQIQAALDDTSPDKVLPYSIRQKIDAIRNVGNFAAHPMADATTSEIINVEPEEAEWCLETIEELFDHYYNTSYQEDIERIARLNENLRRANRPEVRS